MSAAGICQRTCLRGNAGFVTIHFFLALLILGLFATQVLASQDCDTCTPCHGSLEDVHGGVNHAAAPGSGPVVLFDGSSHYEPSERPYFDVVVDCLACHTKNLPAAHGNVCATCHPTPYDTLGIWGKGCQQGGCHAFYHGDSVEAHLPFEDTVNDPYNNCIRCHEVYGWKVTTGKCLTCHAAYSADDVLPPTTASDALSEYIGPARIDFSVTDNGKVAVGRTFYRLDGAPTKAAGKKIFIAELGPHHLEFWSMDQSGNVESAPNNAYFNIIADTTPPTTTSNAQAVYQQDGVITLSATDNGTLGVKRTFYRLDGGVTNSGTLVAVPPSSGDHTIVFWSEDWSGNVETENRVSFNVSPLPK